MQVDLETFRDMVATAIDELPVEWQERLGEIVVLAEDSASPDDLAAMGLGPGDGRDLLGLYVGVPLTERSTMDMGLPDRIMIYREPILSCCETRDDVVREIQETVLHELGHHFGLLEDDLPF